MVNVGESGGEVVTIATYIVSIIALGFSVVSLVYSFRTKAKLEKLTASVVAARLMGSQNTQADMSRPVGSNQQLGAAMSQLASQAQQSHNNNLTAIQGQYYSGMAGATGVVTGKTLLNAGTGYKQ